MTLTDILVVLAIFLGPIVAVRLTRYLDDKKETRNRRLLLYRILMATRAATLSPNHIEALNSIDLEFSNEDAKDKKVRDAWKAYLDHLGDESMPADQWPTRRLDLLVELLSEIGNNVGYSFDKVHIKNAIYAPRFQGDLESDQTAIRKGVRELLDGTRNIPIVVTNLNAPIPPSEEKVPPLASQSE